MQERAAEEVDGAASGLVSEPVDSLTNHVIVNSAQAG
jgi:hypothetical protein